MREQPRNQATLFVAVDEFSKLAMFLKHMDRALGGTLSAFEVMWNDFYSLVTTAPAATMANRPTVTPVTTVAPAPMP